MCHTGSEYGPVARCREHDNETPGFIKVGEFHGQLRDCQFLKELQRCAQTTRFRVRAPSRLHL
jgi:hypothetical protein